MHPCSRSDDHCYRLRVCVRGENGATEKLGLEHPHWTHLTHFCGAELMTWTSYNHVDTNIKFKTALLWSKLLVRDTLIYN